MSMFNNNQYHGDNDMQSGGRIVSVILIVGTIFMAWMLFGFGCL